MLGSNEASEPYDEAESIEARFKLVAGVAVTGCSTGAVAKDTESGVRTGLGLFKLPMELGGNVPVLIGGGVKVG
jgi:hypothetical protein